MVRSIFSTHRCVLAGHWTPRCSPCRCCLCRCPRPPWWWPGCRPRPPGVAGPPWRPPWRPGLCRGEGSLVSCSLSPMMTCYLSVEKSWRGKERRPQPRIPEMIWSSFSLVIYKQYSVKTKTDNQHKVRPLTQTVETCGSVLHCTWDGFTRNVSLVTHVSYHPSVNSGNNKPA